MPQQSSSRIRAHERLGERMQAGGGRCGVVMSRGAGRRAGDECKQRRPGVRAVGQRVVPQCCLPHPVSGGSIRAIAQARSKLCSPRHHA